MQKTLFLITLICFGFNAELNEVTLLQEAGENQQAFEMVDTIIAENSDNVNALIIGANLAILLDNLDKANELYNQAIELDPKNKEYRDLWNHLNEYRTALKNAKKTFDSGYAEESISEYQEIVKDYPNNALTYYTLGLVYKQIDNFDLAVENYKKAQGLNRFEEKYFVAVRSIAQTMTKNGDTEYKRKEYYSAIEFYQQAIQYLPDYTDAIFRLAKTLYRIGDYANSKVHLEKNIQLDENHYQALKMMGDVYKKQGDRDGSIECYKQAIKVNPNYDRAYYSLGSALMSKGDLSGAQSALQNAINSNTEYSKAYETLGVVFSQLGKHELAIENYFQATKYDSRSYTAFYRLSSSFNVLGKYEDAKNAAKSCIKIKSNYAAAHFELGVTEKALGNKVAALASFEKATKDKNWRKSAKYEIDMINRGQ